MSSNINNVAVIGTGVIGAGWIIRCLAHNKKVVAYDKELKLEKKLVSEIKRTWPYVKKLFNKKKLNLKNFKYVTSVEKALINADFIQECATENYAIKTKLMSIIGKYAKLQRHYFIKFIWITSNKNIFKMCKSCSNNDRASF